MSDWSLRSFAAALPNRQFQDLGPRLASGTTLALITLGLTYLGGGAFALLVAAAGTIMCWEWGRIVRRAHIDTTMVIHVAGCLIAVLLAASGQLMLAGVVLLIAAISVLALGLTGPGLLSALGVLYVGVPSIMLVMLRSDASYGFAAVIMILVVVWAVDTAAFLGGRGIGGPKLWPSISPNKTWAGFFSGVLAGVLAGGLIGVALGAPLAHALPVSLLLGMVSQGGDLAESALKREFGVKDSSLLIPGHGGFLDRLDGVVAAATMAGLIGLVANFAQPARALLFGV
jgi:phosphatidate cytidylyltransferase